MAIATATAFALGSLALTAGSMLFGRDQAQPAQAAPILPAALPPAPPAPTRRQDTGATVVVGSDAVKGQRVSGGGSTGATGSRDVLGSLGGGSGLRI